MRYLFNSIIAKKSGAGGFQISCNFARAALNDKKIDWHLVVSQDVGEFIRHEFNPDLFCDRVHVFPTQPSWQTYFKVRKELKALERELKPDVVYSILSPSYFFFDCPEVMRCCNAWDLIPFSHPVYKVVNKSLALRMKLKAQLIIYLMRKTKYFMTQTVEAKIGICRVTGTAENNVCVVPNVLNKTFAEAPKEPIPHEAFNIIMVGAPAPHKNINILPEVARILKDKYRLKEVKFVTTFDPKASSCVALAQKFKENGVEHMWNNVGRKSQKELIDLYRSSDLGFFPSLLETFSATLLEYMCFGLPTVIANMTFNTEVMGDAAFTYSPFDAEAAADQIARIYLSKEIQEDLKNKGYEQLKRFSDFDKYYKDTLAFLREIANIHINKYNYHSK